MKSRRTARALAGIVLIAAGFWLALPKIYRERTYLISLGGCRLETTIFEKKDAASEGTVVLFPGLVANKKVMAFLAEGFAEQNLRVYVPDLPGHGHSPGPFSPVHAEECAEALLSALVARGMANPNRTIVAGHSMGAAIALRVGAKIPGAGVVAISPAPLRGDHGVQREMLLYPNPGPMPQRFLVISGSHEPQSMRGNAADLLASRKDGTAQFILIPRATHASLIFDRAVVRAFQDWTAKSLGLTSTPGMPSLRQLYGTLAGFAGLLLLVNPFLREISRMKHKGAAGQEAAEERVVAGNWPRMLVEFGAAAILVVVLLRFWNLLRVIHLFEGDYLGSFLLILGAALVLMHWKPLREQSSRWKSGLLGAFFGGLILFLLFSAWLELSFYEAWLTPAKWARFPFLFLAFLPYHLAEEIYLGASTHKSPSRRLATGLSLRAVAWAALAFGLFYLHSGEILMVLLLPYFVLLHVLQRRGMDIMRQETGSALATAVFGAILLAGFCLVI
ncbi:MAG TPA: alpha/beta fold hydrolase, partial [Candidatus Dormibacteraeota bacterium]|nr:alpha/beta fold hydrolase [Candidatus Dormibacteraeota bacterium]